MSGAPKILFVDAASRAGWAYGPAGEVPQSGSLFFAKNKSASHGAKFMGAMRFIAGIIQKCGKDTLVFIEEPLPPMWKQGFTNIESTQLLFGLPACIHAKAFEMGCYDVRYCKVSDIRKHFIGKNPKGDQGKVLTMEKCLALGWISSRDEDRSFDRSDALAGWSFAEHQTAPKISQPIDDLFVRAEQRKRERAA